MCYSLVFSSSPFGWLSAFLWDLFIFLFSFVRQIGVRIHLFCLIGQGLDLGFIVGASYVIIFWLYRLFLFRKRLMAYIGLLCSLFVLALVSMYDRGFRVCLMNVFNGNQC